jgi:hypothetical protein
MKRASRSLYMLRACRTTQRIVLFNPSAASASVLAVLLAFSP